MMALTDSIKTLKAPISICLSKCCETKCDSFDEEVNDVEHRNSQ
jgi:hypothetical protein